MPTYRAPVDNVLFLLTDVLGFHRHANLPGFAEATPETVEAVLREGGAVRGGAARAAQPGRRRRGLHAP